MIVQIFINKDTGKIQGWGTGSGYQTSQNCETKMVPMIDEDVRMLLTEDAIMPGENRVVRINTQIARYLFRPLLFN